jgi:CRISPR-associated protein Csm1
LNEQARNLISYGIALLRRAGIEINPPPGQDIRIAWGKYEEVLGSQTQQANGLTSIFSEITLQSSHPRRKRLVIPPGVLDISGTDAIEASPLMPADQPGRYGVEFDKVAQDFSHLEARWGTIPALYLEGFSFLMRRYAWSLPSTLRIPGVSLFEQWKAVAALVAASGSDWKNGPAAEFTLVGGDIPGIQDFVFTITSKGASKGLRGRSFFIQLLGDAILERLLAELDLWRMNVIYAAGGNFMLIAPALDSKLFKGSTVTDALTGLRSGLETSLLAEFNGDLSLCLEWETLQQDEIKSTDFSRRASKALKEKIADAKRHRFSNAVADAWVGIFSPQARAGNRRCNTCQRPLGIHDSVKVQTPPGTEEEYRCHPCEGFQQLAARIGQQGDLYLSIDRQAPGSATDQWQQILYRVSQHHYTISRTESHVSLPASQRKYLINRTDFVSRGMLGFRFIANATPGVIPADIDRWSSSEDEDEEPPVIDHIRTFGQMADLSEGIARLGVLRMDVDNLGHIITGGLPLRNLVTTSALSWALDIFFSGWLNQICARVNRLRPTDPQGLGRGDRLYTIYAGGDDLFVVGSWDLIPELAAAIREDFRKYTGDNPDLSISGGIVLEERKFPLYQAAERSGAAEDHAKHYLRHGSDKNAITFLGLPIKWDEWPALCQYRDKMLEVINSESVPQAFLRVLLDIYSQYAEQRRTKHKQLADEADREFSSSAAISQAQPGKPRRPLVKLPDEPDEYLYYGPWMWRLSYALSRMAGQVRHRDETAAKIIQDIQASCLEPAQIRLIALAARWVDLLTRKGE